MSASWKASLVCVATATAVFLLLLVETTGSRACNNGGVPLAQLVPVKRFRPDRHEAPAPAPAPFPKPAPAPKPSPPAPSARDSTPPQLATGLHLDEQARAGRPRGAAGTAVPVVKLAAIEPFNPVPRSTVQSRRQIKLPKSTHRSPGSPPMPCVDWDLALVARMVRANAARVVVRTQDERGWLVIPEAGRWRVTVFESDLPLGAVAFELDQSVSGIEQLRSQVQQTARSPVVCFQLACSTVILESFQARQYAALEQAAVPPAAVAMTAGTIQWTAGQPVYVVDELVFNDGRRQELACHTVTLDRP